MELEIEVSGALPCDTAIFRINRMNANSGDFGVSEDKGFQYAPYHGCGRRTFTANRTRENMKRCIEKYAITESEFDEICDRLEEELYVGGCVWCV